MKTCSYCGDDRDQVDDTFACQKCGGRGVSLRLPTFAGVGAMSSCPITAQAVEAAKTELEAQLAKLPPDRAAALLRGVAEAIARAERVAIPTGTVSVVAHGEIVVTGFATDAVYAPPDAPNLARLQRWLAIAAGYAGGKVLDAAASELVAFAKTQLVAVLAAQQFATAEPPRGDVCEAPPATVIEQHDPAAVTAPPPPGRKQ